MKTLIQKLTIAFTITLFTFSIYAQNTKSLRFEGYREKVIHVVGNRMNSFNHDISICTDKLMTYVKYQPSHIDSQSYETIDFTSDIQLISTQLEKEVKFVPTAFNETGKNRVDSSITLMELTQNIEQSVRYYPSEDIKTTGLQNSELENITNLLAQDVKFQPVLTNN
jgi:hypothetical protein